MPQPIRITVTRAVDLYFRWPYQAKVMKILEAMSRPMVMTGMGIGTLRSALRKAERGIGALQSGRMRI